MIINTILKGNGDSGDLATTTITKTGNGTIAPRGTVKMTKGNNLSVSWEADSGYVVDSVIIDGVSVPTTSPYTFSNLQSNHTVGVTFEYAPPKRYTLGIPSGTANPTSKNIYWADDASGLTEAQRDALIKEHTRFAVVSWDGSKPAVNYWLYRNNLNQKATDNTCNTSAGTSSNLTGTDGDVMVLYDPVWWKVAKSGNDWRITFTWTQPSESGWVSPHTYGDNTSSTSIAKYVGMGVFEGIIKSNQLRSVNESSNPTVSTSQNNFYTAATYSRNWQYNNKLPMTWAWYIITLYFVKGDRDCQNAYGNGLVGMSAASVVNKDWSATNAWNKGATSNQTSGVTALGIHNPWGDVSELLGECRYDNSAIKFSVLGGKDHYNINSGTAITWKSVTVSTDTRGYTPSEITGTCQEYPFFATGTSGSSGYSTYYADAWNGSPNSTECVYVGGEWGDWGDAQKAGPLFVYLNDYVSSTRNYVGARLHILIT